MQSEVFDWFRPIGVSENTALKATTLSLVSRSTFWALAFAFLIHGHCSAQTCADYIATLEISNPTDVQLKPFTDLVNSTTLAVAAADVRASPSATPDTSQIGAFLVTRASMACGIFAEIPFKTALVAGAVEWEERSANPNNPHLGQN